VLSVSSAALSSSSWLSKFGVFPKACLCAGFLGFYRGLRAKIVQSVLAAAILFAVREKLYALTQKALAATPAVKLAKAK